MGDLKAQDFWTPTATFWILTCALFAVAVVRPPAAAASATEPAILEFRRTFNAPACSTGDVYINGRFAAVFSILPTVFDSRLKSNPFVGDQLSSAAYDTPLSSLHGVVFGADMTAESGAPALRLIALDGRYYSDYDRPRNKARALPADLILLGTRLLNRQCLIQSTSGDDYFDDDNAMQSASAILSNLVFNGTLNAGNFGSHATAAVIAIFTDASATLQVDAGTLAFSRQVAVRKAEAIAAGDPCLTRIEHGANTIVHAGGATTYERRDDTWYCATAALSGGVGPTAIEFYRTLRYIEFRSYDECGSVLGIPLGKTYLVSRTPAGGGSAVWSKCYGTEDFQKVSDTSHIGPDPP